MLLSPQSHCIITDKFQRYLLPLITQSHHARYSLRSHHLSLLRNLSASLSSLKESQAESFAVIPRSHPLEEDSPDTTCNVLSSLSTLSSSLSKTYHLPSLEHSRQDTLQALTTLTGYLATQLYALPSALSFRAPGMGVVSTFGPAEEELRREIRALKGLVLNRCVLFSILTEGAAVTNWRELLKAIVPACTANGTSC
jgi:hypothetical protein